MAKISRCAELWGDILAAEPPWAARYSDMKDAIGPLGDRDHLVPVLLHELASPALPAHRLLSQGCPFTLQPVGGSPGRTGAG